MDQNHMLPRSTPESRSSPRPSNQNDPPPPHSPPPPPPLPPSYSNNTSQAPPTQAVEQDTDHASSYSLPHISVNALPPIQPAAQHENSLPSLSSVTGSNLYRDSPLESKQMAMSSPPPPAPPAMPPAANHWPSMNPLTQFYTPSHMQSSPAESPARMVVDSPTGYNRGNSVSLDDPDVRMAAEALGDLRADFISSPPQKHLSLSSSPSIRGTSSSGSATPKGQSEPLLSLLTTAHPSIATTLEGASAAYSSGKKFSPRFKSSAEYVEGIVSPVADKVGSVGKVTGVEGGLRWYLRKAARGRRLKFTKDPGNVEVFKRRRVAKDAATPAVPGAPVSEQVSQRKAPEPDRRLSVTTIETLPAYDDTRSPEYAEIEAMANANANEARKRGLPTRLLMTTSGLSISMSEESLRSLKFCLNWLRWANGHISQVIETLKTSLEQHDEKMANADTMEEGQIAWEKSLIAERIAALKSEVLKTLQEAIQTVSRCAGGALPDNARELVRSQLTSLPQRFFHAQKGQASGTDQVEHAESESKEKAVHEGAQKVLVLAREGLDMMSQVSSVLDGTIVSAEEWCDKLGRNKRKADGSSSSVVPPNDTKQAIAAFSGLSGPLAITPMVLPPAAATTPTSLRDVEMTG